jgi:hypothetical protein
VDGLEGVVDNILSKNADANVPKPFTEAHAKSYGWLVSLKYSDNITIYDYDDEH